MKDQEFICIGQIVNAVGLKGEVKIYSYAASDELFQTIDGLYLGGKPKGALKPDVRGKEAAVPAADLTWQDIESVRYKGITPILKLSGLPDRTAAEGCQFRYVYIRTSQLPKLPEGEYYVHELTGLSVHEEDGTLLGTLEDIRTDTPQKLYVIRRTTGEELLLPGVPAFIRDQDPEEGRITVRLPEGLLDL